jgi:hypothetical protein
VRRLPAAALALAAACGDSTEPGDGSRALVGTYAIEATYTTLRPDARLPATTPATATLSGTVVVADTSVTNGALITFPDVRLTAAFCATRGACSPSESYGGVTTYFGPGSPVTLVFSSIAGARTLHFEGPPAGDSIVGFAWYQVNNARYDGSFVARKRR